MCAQNLVHSLCNPPQPSNFHAGLYTKHPINKSMHHKDAPCFQQQRHTSGDTTVATVGKKEMAERKRLYTKRTASYSVFKISSATLAACVFWWVCRRKRLQMVRRDDPNCVSPPSYAQLDNPRPCTLYTYTPNQQAHPSYQCIGDAPLGNICDCIRNLARQLPYQLRAALVTNNKDLVLLFLLACV